MRMPHFLRLAQLDNRHFITACRHGLVHLTWDRTTVRFSRDEFRRLVRLLERVEGAVPPSLRDGNLRVTARLDEDCELQMGSLVLLVSPDRLSAFARTAQEALDRLDGFLASGVWDRDEPEEAPPDIFGQIRGTRFSQN
jgi:hypothetical protein